MTVGSSSLYETYLSYGSTNSQNRTSGSGFAEALLTSMDSDGSGSVDSAEFSSAALALSISDESAISSAFSSLDSDGDGTISQEELSASLSQSSGMVAGSMPPPPPPPSSSESEDTGYTQEELTAMAEDVGLSDSNLASLLESVIENFDEADANEDGKVSSAEAQAYKESTKADSIGTEEVASSSSEEESLMSALLAQIVSRYSSQTSLSGSSFNLSA